MNKELIKKKSYKIQWSDLKYSKKYGGQFHFDVIGLAKKKILGNGWFWRTAIDC